ncbi:cell adhesion molecule 2-like [Sebastes fasciatus]|uniref:cell adhesion molecule 2-like n=1 Tax=Sebastes fasciatus TaxID=394691 RepID=UPI003D9DF05E
MMGVMSFSSDVVTQHVSGWVSIIWFATAVSVAVSQGVKLQTDPQVAARCGDNVTLTCDASSSGQLDNNSLFWVASNKNVCQHREGQPDSKVLCEITAQPPHHRLTLTLPNVMPVDQGEYLCKLRSPQGAKFNKTVVTVQDCFESSDSFINESRAECWFSGVYPRATVRWFRGSVNLTDTASTQEEEDHHGRYNVSSTIDVQRGNLSTPYTCSLWIPSAGKELTGIGLPLPIIGQKLTANDSSGSMVKLQWICIMVEIMMVKLMI